MESTEYFARQIAIPEFGIEGLKQLQSKCVGIAGVGGVGSSAAYYLAKSGVGKLLLVDQDIVDSSNLQRVHLVADEDLYHPKAEVIARNVQNTSKSTSAKPVIDTITDRNVDQLLDESDLIFDGLDNFRTRYIVNRFAARNDTPYMFVSAISQQAHLALLEPSEGPCLECFMPGVKDGIENSCEVLGVSPTITGLAGALGATIAIKHLLGKSAAVSNYLFTVDLGGPDFLRSQIRKRAACGTCTSPAGDEVKISPTITSLCGERTANIMPLDDTEHDLSEISRKISPASILLSSDSVLVFRHGPHIVSMFPNGRLLIGEVNEEIQASRIATEVRDLIEGN
jgi:molybdopterin-synthase adenylyltransferase